MQSEREVNPMRPRLLMSGGAILLFLIVCNLSPNAAATRQHEHPPVMLIRHTDATVGDDLKVGFQMQDCTTQRNLSEQGRDAARRQGRNFRMLGIRVGKLLASPFCRTLETAMLMNLGPVDATPALGNIRPDAANDKQIADARALIAAWTGPGVLIMVTHSSTILALTGVEPEPGGIVVLDPARGDLSKLRMVGRIDFK
jgi:phosphohistidine phosphatase SixA